MEGLLRESDGSEGASASERPDRASPRGCLRTQPGSRGEHFHSGNPSTYTGEAVFAVMALFRTESAPLAERVAAAVARMEAIRVPAAGPRGAAGALADRASDARVRHAPWPLREGVGLLAAEAITARLAAAAERAAGPSPRFRPSGGLRRSPSEGTPPERSPWPLPARGAFPEGPRRHRPLRRGRAGRGESASRLTPVTSASDPEGKDGRILALHPSTENYYARYQSCGRGESRGRRAWPVTWGRRPSATCRARPPAGGRASPPFPLSPPAAFTGRRSRLPRHARRPRPARKEQQRLSSRTTTAP